MAVTHPTATRNGLADNIVDQLDGGTIVFLTSGDVEVATCTFGTPAFGAATGGTATANAITGDASATGGTIAKAELRNSVSTPIVLCSVTASGGGGDIIITDVVVVATEAVDVSSLTYSAPA